MKQEQDRPGVLFVLASPSGGGKTTLIREVRKLLPDLQYSVSVSTRSPGPGEANAADYFFVTREEFERRVRAGFFAEWAEVHGHWYGTPRQYLEEQLGAGRDVILDLDVQGAQSLRERYGPHTVTVFVLPPSFAVLEARLRTRRRDTAEEMERRLHEAKAELSRLGEFDYYVVNREIEQARNDLWAIIVAERLRVARMPLSLRRGFGV